MKIKKGYEKKYKMAYNNNLHPYGHAIYTFAERWADLLENLIDDGVDPETAIMEKAETYSYEADKEHITGFMFASAIYVLTYFWRYGDILDKWFIYGPGKDICEERMGDLYERKLQRSELSKIL